MNQQWSEELYARKPLTITPINVIQLRHFLKDRGQMAFHQTKATRSESEKSISNIYEFRTGAKNKPVVER